MKTGPLAIFLAMIASTALAATTPAPVLVNPSFAQRNPASGKPAGWVPFGGDIDARTECEATCALHLQSRAGSGQTDGIYQLVAPGSAAGHVLIVSACIRGGQGAGNVFLGVNVFGAAGQIAEHANGPASSAAAGWQSVELRVPVPANATMLAIGAALRGKGEAWIERLALQIDESVAVAAHVPESPPRPAPSQTLLDDAALRIAPADAPIIPPAQRSDVASRIHPVRSLFSDDFSDLQFLKPLLEGKRIVQLGEAAHGVAESNWAKVRLVRFLHQQMGFDVIAFESSFSQCFDANRQVGVLARHEVMGRCLFPAWNTREVDGLFDTMAALRDSPKPLTLAGFDVQFSGYGDDRPRLSGMLGIADPGLAAHLDDHENALTSGKALTAQRSASIQAFYSNVAIRFEAQRARLRASGYSPADIDAAIQTAHARTWLARMEEHLDVPNSPQGNAIRDAGMAEQLEFLLDRLYPGHKIIVWAHNQHVTNAHADGDATSMGEILARCRRAQMYTVGFYMGHGVVGNGQETVWTVARPSAGTVDGVLANGGFKYGFVDFSQAVPGPSSAWFTDKNTVREFGTVPKTIVPARSYDAIFYIDTVTPAEKY